VGSMLVKNNPSFDARNYGFRKLIEMVKEQSCVEVRTEKVGSGVLVRLK